MVLKQRLIWAVSIAAVAFVLVAPVLDRFIFPEPELPARAYPIVGQVFHSEAEGFSQRIAKIDDEHIWSELTLHPNAPGPPALHTTLR